MSAVPLLDCRRITDEMRSRRLAVSAARSRYSVSAGRGRGDAGDTVYNIVGPVAHCHSRRSARRAESETRIKRNDTTPPHTRYARKKDGNAESTMESSTQPLLRNRFYITLFSSSVTSFRTGRTLYLLYSTVHQQQNQQNAVEYHPALPGLSTRDTARRDASETRCKRTTVAHQCASTVAFRQGEA